MRRKGVHVGSIAGENFAARLRGNGDYGRIDDIGGSRKTAQLTRALGKSRIEWDHVAGIEEPGKTSLPRTAPRLCQGRCRYDKRDSGGDRVFETEPELPVVPIGRDESARVEDQSFQRVLAARSSTSVISPCSASQSRMSSLAN